MLSKAVHNDKASEFDRRLSTIAGDLDSNRVRDAYKGIRALKKYEPKPPKMTCTDEGIMARNSYEVRRIWMDHWADGLDGDELDFGDVVRLEREWDSDKPSISEQVLQDLDSMPTPQETTSVFHVVKKWKAWGEDCIPGELFTMLSTTLTAVFFPLFARLL